MGILEIGRCYFVRTDTDHWVGRLTQHLPFCLVLEDAAWVADCGRLSEFMRDGKTPQMETEYVGVIQAYHPKAVLPWPHPLLKTN